jgi:hypothetical protein
MHQLSVPIEDLLGRLFEGLAIHRAFGSDGLHILEESDDLGALLGRERLDLVDDFVGGHGVQKLWDGRLVGKLVFHLG